MLAKSNVKKKAWPTDGMFLPLEITGSTEIDKEENFNRSYPMVDLFCHLYYHDIHAPKA